MANLVISGDTSGSVTLSAPAVSGTTVLTLPTTSGTLVTTGGGSTGSFTTLTSSGDSSFATSSGNVGIGTSSPVVKLQSAGGFLATGSAAAFAANAIIVDVSSGISRISAAGADNSTQGTLTFNTGSANAGIFNERMRINSAGDVAIGSTNPDPFSSFQTRMVSISSSGGGTGSALNITSGAGSRIQLGIGTTRTAILYSDNTNYTSLSTETALPLVFLTNQTERMRIASNGNVGIGTTNIAANARLSVAQVTEPVNIGTQNAPLCVYRVANDSHIGLGYATGIDAFFVGVSYNGTGAYKPLAFATSDAERARIDTSGNFYIGKTSAALATTGFEFNVGTSAYSVFTNTRTDGDGNLVIINRQGSDGNLIAFAQASTVEGSITVSGTTVSYNGGHLSRWSQLPDGTKDDTILKGTVLTNIDDMCVWEKDGVVADNEQLNKMKVSDVEGDTNVAGVFVNWTIDEQYGVDDMNVAMTGDMIIRIADGVVVQKGDLLMSAGDGTAMPQGDDIVRSKTIAKVTSNYVTCTYADGSYCVPCVLMAC